MCSTVPLTAEGLSSARCGVCSRLNTLLQGWREEFTQRRFPARARNTGSPATAFCVRRSSCESRSRPWQRSSASFPPAGSSRGTTCSTPLGQVLPDLAVVIREVPLDRRELEPAQDRARWLAQQ